MNMPPRRVVLGALSLAMAGGLVFACRTTDTKAGGALVGDAAARTYVAPGKHDDYYAFLSGGFSGQLTVYGLPSGRLHEISSIYGHDAFLKESEQLRPIFNAAIGSTL